MAKTAKREESKKDDRQAAQERTARVLTGTVKRLQRLGGRRASREAKQAYREAADLVKGLTKK